MSDRIHPFPTPLPNEFFGGTLLRYHESYGQCGLLETLREPLKLGRNAVLGIPTALSQFATRTSRVWECGVSTILNRHTTWPLYRPFLSERSLSQAWKQINTGPRGILQLTIGDSASRLHLRPRLQMCVQCARGDLDSVGYPYLHVDHQLPGIRACIAHHIVLQTLPVADVFRGMPLASALDIGIDCESASTGELELAELARGMWEGNIERLRPGHVQTAYQERLRAIGLLTSCHRIRHQKTADLIESHFPSNVLVRFGASRGMLHRWVHDLVDRPDRTHHPIKHLILIGALFGNISSFLAEIHQREFLFNSGSSVETVGERWLRQLPK